MKNSDSSQADRLNQRVICQHNQVGCLIDDNKYLSLCKMECQENLKCGHICNGKCFECVMGLLHKPCEQIVEKKLLCGHTIWEECYKVPVICQRACEVRHCEHDKNFPQCDRGCSSVCSFDHGNYHCRVCQDSDQVALPCNHTGYNIVGSFFEQFAENPFAIPLCKAPDCETEMIHMKFKNEIKRAKRNISTFLEAMDKKKITDLPEIDDGVFQKELSRFKILQILERKEISSNTEQTKKIFCTLAILLNEALQLLLDFQSKNNQKSKIGQCLKTLEMQLLLLKELYLEREWDRISFEHLLNVHNCIIFLQTLIIVSNGNQSPLEDPSIILHLCTSTKFKLFTKRFGVDHKTYWTHQNCSTPMYSPISFSVCSNQHTLLEKNSTQTIRSCFVCKNKSNKKSEQLKLLKFYYYNPFQSKQPQIE